MVNSWTLNEYIPILVPQQANYNVDQPAAVQFVAGINGWSYDVFQSGVSIAGAEGAYGENTQQFAELSDLWLTYRINAVDCQLTPNNPGAGNQSGVFVVRDTGAEQVPYPLGNDSILNRYSTLKDVRLTPPNKKAQMKQNYQGLLMQVCPQPFLQTVDANGAGEREEYPDLSNSIVPFIRMAYTNTGGSITEQGYQLGIFLVKAHYSVRGRRATPLTAALKAARMNSRDQLEMFAALLKLIEARREQEKPKFPPQDIVSRPIDCDLAMLQYEKSCKAKRV